ncbi:signal peptidase I [Alkalibacillus filiformis]|uniref:Signal peptidase I n=1 Tax=Alkalibacillus filiformis TaxID=200990 RepID=A0ABU0DPT5_9BACI|nr:signal peptidase I [Alkalibacillus filiformis]MDQ0350427.1 signal peptidase I [Alkalibacillus filiformis]
MKREIWEWTKAIVIALVIAFILRTFVFATSVVEGASMDPTLESGERVIFNKAVYIVDEPERGDIVIIQHPHKNYVKRVIGLPNETLEARDNVLYIDGEAVDEGYLTDHELEGTGNIDPIEIPDGQYYVMGDNREISKDSRNGLGLIEGEDIIGRSEVIIFPFSNMSLTR